MLFGLIFYDYNTQIKPQQNNIATNNLWTLPGNSMTRPTINNTIPSFPIIVNDAFPSVNSINNLWFLNIPRVVNPEFSLICAPSIIEHQFVWKNVAKYTARKMFKLAHNAKLPRYFKFIRYILSFLFFCLFFYFDIKKKIQKSNRYVVILVFRYSYWF